jgi:hypothetical protein
MFFIGEDQKWLIEKDLFTFRIGDPMLVPILAPISLVPVETDELFENQHLRSPSSRRCVL